MARWREALETIRVQLGRMTATQRLLIGSLCVIALMTLFLVTQYTARPSMVGLMVDDPNQELVETLRVGGIDAKLVNGQVVVPKGERRRAIAQLGESGQLPGDTEVMFRNLIPLQDWKASKSQNDQLYRLALQNELGRVIGQFSGIASASVIIDVPESQGWGRAATVPTASATVFTADGGALPQATVDAVARLIAGTQSGLRPDRVQVIDGSTGRPRNATNEDEVQATSYLEHAQRMEQTTQRKLTDLLSYIAGATVTVTAQVDVTRVQSSTERALPKGNGTESVLTSSTDKTDTMSNASRAAEAGVRSNQQADINTGGSTGTQSEMADSTTAFTVLPGREVRSVVDPRGMATYLAATVTIPQSYIEGLILRARQREAGDGAEADQQPLTDAEIEQRFEELKPKFVEQISPHLAYVGPDGTMMPGEVTVSMVQAVQVAPVAPAMAGATGFLAMLNGGGSGGGGVPGLGGGVIELALVSGLAVLALLMMMVLVRKGGKRIELPTAEELAGVPPALNAKLDIVGEADESDTPMEGIELDDMDMKSQKMLEQVGELVAKDPGSAAALLGRWIRLED
ncbi:MAG: flagellar M-ring protein FliF C-terminal domain-containing protein [Phycisphaerales bacterium]